MRYKINNILACVDSSQYSTTLMKYSAYIAKAFKAKIEALHVIDLLQLEGPFMYDVSGALGLEPFSNFSGKIKGMLEEKGRNVISSFKEIVDFYGVEFDSRMEMGVVSSVIVDESEHFDIVFIGRKGVNASYERGILGSNIEPVIRKIEKPLFISNEQFYTPRTLVIAYDGSDVSMAALEFAKLYKEKFDVSMHIVNVGTNKEKSEALFKELPTYFEKKFIESEDVSKSIISYVNELDNPLLFLGAYSKNRVLEMILGSTTETILRQNLKFPLIVVR